MIIINEYSFPSVPVETEIGTHTITSIYEKEHEEYTVLNGTVNIASKLIISEITSEMESDTTIKIVATLVGNLTGLAKEITKLILRDPDFLTESKIVCNKTGIANLTLQNGIDKAKVINGVYPIYLFDQYQIYYINKGSSDKLQTPEVKNIQEVPDGKDVFKVVSDPRASIQIPYTVTTKTNLGKIATKDFSQTTTQTFNMIKLWIQDYVTIRRNL